MTAKEKAEELIHKYILNTPVGFHFDDAKKCALIAVDEILEVIIFNKYDDKYWEEEEYWQEIKQELEKL